MKRLCMRFWFVAPSVLIWYGGQSLSAQATSAQAKSPVPAMTEAGYVRLFDGKTLAGWDCDSDFWRAEAGALVGQSRVDHQPKQNTFCIWRGGQPSDFDLRLEYRLTGDTDGNSGVQYRSIERPDVARWVLEGYQADIDLAQTYTGQLYEERGRGFLALRGQVARAAGDGKPGSIGSLGEKSDLRALIKDNDWNQVEILANGSTIVHIVNGRTTAVFVDGNGAYARRSGLIGIQLHRLQGTGMRIEVRNIRLQQSSK